MPPLVSICCVTYNQADTIAQALESFLAQRADVPVEILVHDDASTDGTDAILAAYAARYPDEVFPLLETENQYRKGIAMDATFNFPRAKGEYLALCEGDDYWCDPHKLKKQVAYLQANPECTFCFTNGYVALPGETQPTRPFLPYYPEEAAWYAPETRRYDLGAITRLSFIPTASFMFPRAALQKVPRELLLAPCPAGDLRLKLLLTGVGEAAYLHEFTCVYRLGVAGSTMAGWGTEPTEKTRERCQRVIAMLRGVNAFTHALWDSDLQRLVDDQYRVLIEAAPDRALLAEPEARRVFRRLPLARRLKTRAKMCLPQTWYRFIKRLANRG